jgi:hypothetical protein
LYWIKLHLIWRYKATVLEVNKHQQTGHVETSMEEIGNWRSLLKWGQMLEKVATHMYDVAYLLLIILPVLGRLDLFLIWAILAESYQVLVIATKAFVLGPEQLVASRPY